MRFLNQIAVFSSTLLLTAGTVALAASPAGQQPGGHLKISEVFVDFVGSEIVITGEDFDFGPGPLVVTLGDPDLIDSNSCADVSPQKIVCDFSAGGLPDDGDYLLTVAMGAGQSQSDEYDLTALLLLAWKNKLRLINDMHYILPNL